MQSQVKILPKEIKEEYAKGVDFKTSLGEKGIFEQAKRNERFYIGDQWYGAKCGSERPLVRRNIIKRIGEYKLATVTASPITVNYSADGVPHTTDMQESIDGAREEIMNGAVSTEVAEAPEIAVICSALSDYYRTTAERLKFNEIKEQVLRNAYISGTGVLFTYWDGNIETGLYADEGRKQAIKGDIVCEVLDIENVNFGDPNCENVQNQPFIIVAQRREIEEVRREAYRNGLDAEEIKSEELDGEGYYSGDRGKEPTESKRVTVYTKLYKEWNKDGTEYKVMAVRTTDKAYVRKPWDLKLKNYPISKFCWERRRSSAYGESEITYLIPNQIAVNRALTAAVWGLMQSGMPIMIVNGDTISGPVTNEPGQIIKIYGTNEDVAGAIRYLQPPNSTTQFQNMVNDISANTLSDAGANDAALGNLRPDNASALIVMREAAMAPMQIYINRFYDFIEDTARIWADFWINLYGKRSIRLENKEGVQYMPFDSERYKNLILTARVDVGASTVYSEAVVISTLDNLLKSGLITFQQYLERLPKGIIPNVTGLIDDIKEGKQSGGDEITDEEVLEAVRQKYPEQYNKLMQMSESQRAQMLLQIRQQMNKTPDTELQEEDEA